MILTARSGVKDSRNNCISAQLPTVYRELVGCHAAEYDPIGWGTNSVKFADGTRFSCKQWCDILETEAAENLARYDSDFYAGSPAVTVNRYGSGKAYYIGTVGERKLYEHIAREILDANHLKYYAELPDNVEITTRTGDGVTVQLVFNNSDEEKNFRLNGKDVHLQPFEMQYFCAE